MFGVWICCFDFLLFAREVLVFVCNIFVGTSTLRGKESEPDRDGVDHDACCLDLLSLLLFLLLLLFAGDILLFNCLNVCWNLHTARERVSQMETVWIMMEKLAWKSMNRPQVKLS